ncbi:protein of unknown function [Burkholderia multivorans]
MLRSMLEGPFASAKQPFERPCQYAGECRKLADYRLMQSAEVDPLSSSCRRRTIGCSQAYRRSSAHGQLNQRL